MMAENRVSIRSGKVPDLYDNGDLLAALWAFRMTTACGQTQKYVDLGSRPR